MTELHDQNQQDLVPNLVNDPVVADPNRIPALAMWAAWVGDDKLPGNRDQPEGVCWPDPSPV